MNGPDVFFGFTGLHMIVTLVRFDRGNVTWKRKQVRFTMSSTNRELFGKKTSSPNER